MNDKMIQPEADSFFDEIANNFTNVSNEIAESLNNLGMVTDAKWIDIDNDKDIDLVVVGHWMPITIFENVNGNFIKSENLSLKNSSVKLVLDGSETANPTVSPNKALIGGLIPEIL